MDSERDDTFSTLEVAGDTIPDFFFETLSALRRNGCDLSRWVDAAQIPSIPSELVDSATYSRDLKCMQEMKADLILRLNGLRELIRNMRTTETLLEEKIDRLGSHIARTALTHGLGLLSNELLLAIFELASEDDATQLFGLSHVCRRFLTLITSSKCSWRRYDLSNNQSCDRLLAIAKRSGLNQLRGVIRVVQPDLDASAKMLLSELHPCLRSLELLDISDAIAEEMHRLLGKIQMPQLETLRIRTKDQKGQNAKCLLELWSMPTLRHITVNFVPHPRLAVGLVALWLKLDDDSSFSLKSFCDFLSSSYSLEELMLYVGKGEINDEKTTSSLDVVTMPNLVSTFIHISRAASSRATRLAEMLVTKIHAPAVRTLNLLVANRKSTWNVLPRILYAFPCIRDLCLNVESPQRDVNLGRILYAIPRTLEGICITTKAAVQIHRLENSEFFRTFSLRHGLIISDSDTSSEGFEEFLVQGPNCTFNLVDINDVERESEHDLLLCGMACHF